jgi:SAM-dependent methyltransferase
MDPYDSLFYEGICFPETHPESLAVLGRLFGLPAAEPADCRVLELGCATGANLIPMAAGLPGATLVGIDLSGPQVEAGCRLAARLGLKNLSLHRGDILDLEPDALGTFDYVIAHGVYSWVPPAVARRLLWLGHRLLAPHGLFYLSYNCLPGWRIRGMLRDILRDACRGETEPRVRLAAAGAALARLDAALHGLPGVAAQVLREEIRQVRAAPPSYLYFEYLAEHNRPVLFRDFAQDCAAEGLSYLCDTQLHTLFPASLGDGVERALADLEDGLELEQWLDFAGNRGFRQSLLIRDDAGIEEGLSLERFARLSLGADLRPPLQARLKDARPVDFVRPGGEPIAVCHPLTKAALAGLAARYPDCLPVTEVIPEARAQVLRAGAGAEADAADEALSELFGLFARGAVMARLHPRRLDPVTPARPRATDLARVLAGEGLSRVPTRDHANVDLDAVSAALIGYMDGSRDRESLTRCLLSDLARGAIGSGGTSAPGPAGAVPRPDRIPARVRNLIALFYRYGVIGQGPAD